MQRTSHHSLQTRTLEPGEGDRPIDAAPQKGRVKVDAPVVIPLERGRTLHVLPGPDGAQLRVRDETGAALEIQISFDLSGPIVGVRAQRLTLEASEHVVARCDTFTVQARQRIELISEGEIVQKSAGNTELHARNLELTAEPGAIRVAANDDVQLLGENVLLNCDRPKSLPDWTRPRIRPEPAPLPPETEAGAQGLIEFLAD